MYRSALILLLILPAYFGQAQNKGTLSGVLLDSLNKDPISLATVSVFRVSDTSIVSYRLSDPGGKFRITALPLATPLRFVVTYAGYATIRREFELTESRPALLLDTLRLSHQPDSLAEVVFTAEIPPVIVRNDTIEFNASSFKTLPTALVEDLLKKLPGVQVDREGNISVNGIPVNRIMVDGKAFFANDPKMATRNLPANLIDKVQVTDDKEQINQSIDGDLSDIGKVINLTLRKGVKKGWFGKVYGGGGTADRYEAGAIANIFRDTLQLSLLGFANNVNRSGFSMKDISELGGFGRSGMNSMTVSNSRGNIGYRINGISFGGMANGITSTLGAGFNLNHAPSTRQTFHLQYFYGEGRSNLVEQTVSQQFFRDSSITTSTNGTSRDVNAAHNFAGGLKLKLDSLTDFELNANYSIAANSNTKYETLNTVADEADLLGGGAGDRINRLTNNRYRHEIRLNKRFSAKKGRVLDISHDFGINRNDRNYLTEQLNVFHPADSVLFEQMRLEDIPEAEGSLTANFTEQLSKKLSARFSERLEYLSNDQSITTFGKNVANGKYDDTDHDLSSELRRRQLRSTTSVALTYGIGKVKLTAGLNAFWQNIDNTVSAGAQHSNDHYFDWMPSFRITWKRLSVSYSKNVQAPSIDHMNPVPDNTNPFYIRQSNFYLKPATSDLISANFYTALPKHGININGYIYAGLTDNAVVFERTIDDRGVQTNKPVNADGAKRLNSNLSFSKEFKKASGFSLTINPTLWTSYNQQKLIVNKNIGTYETYALSPVIAFGLNWNDVVEFRPSYRVFVSRTRYSETSFNDINATTHNLDGELIVRWPKNFVWETNVNRLSNPSVAPGMPNTTVLWNAAINYLFLKNQRGNVKLSVYDLLNRNNNYYRVTSENYIRDYRSNILRRYFLLTFTYDVRMSGKRAKVGGRGSMFGF